MSEDGRPGWADKDLGHPHGRRWHLSFYDRTSSGFTYLGLSLSHFCSRFPLVPPSSRLSSVYILGKDRAYLTAPPRIFSNWGETLRRVTERTGVTFTIGTVQRGRPGEDELPDRVVKDVGTQTRERFLELVGQHMALLGIGTPPQPSSPLEALCVGTPFINREPSASALPDAV